MKVWALSRSKDGFSLSLTETPRWAVLIEEGWEAFLTALGEPCCHFYTCDHPAPCDLGEHPEHRHTWAGKLSHYLPKWPQWTALKGTEYEYKANPQEELEVWQFRLLNIWPNQLIHRYATRHISVPIDVETARGISPGFVRDMESLDL